MCVCFVRSTKGQKLIDSIYDEKKASSAHVLQDKEMKKQCISQAENIIIHSKNCKKKKKKRSEASVCLVYDVFFFFTTLRLFYDDIKSSVS